MHISSRRGIFPWFTIIEGSIGLFLQRWLFSTADPRGLLPRFHFAGIVSFLLLALTFSICWIGARKEEYTSLDRLFLAYPPASAGIAVSAVGFAISGFTVSGLSFLQILTTAFGLLAAAAMVYIAFCRLKGLQADCLLHCIITVYLLLRTMSCCSLWSSEPQLLRYFFPLMACVLLLIASYYRAAIRLGAISCSRYVFFSQAALFCCLICIGEDWLFYLSAAIWLTFDFPAPSSVHTGRFMR